MVEKPGIIKRLEKKIGIELKKIELKYIYRATNGYAIDERGNIIGLNLYNVKISDVSPLRELTALTYLYLFDNQITDVSPLLDLKNLRRLVLTDNHISQLPPEFLQLGMEIKWKDDIGSGIFLKDNPLETPPVEIVKQGTSAVRNYFTQLEKAQVRLPHAKLLIVGNGEVGKTTLMKKLKDNNLKVEIGKEETTHGINIVPWELKCSFAPGDSAPIKIHFWDFGGQDIYHATHQFFLTKRSLYLFVWEARKEEESRSFDYWRNFIIVYSEAEDFYGLWQKYLTHVPDIDLKYKLTRAPEEEDTPWAGIRLARTRHSREGKEVIVYHLFVNMPHGMGDL